MPDIVDSLRDMSKTLRHEPRLDAADLLIEAARKIDVLRHRLAELGGREDVAPPSIVWTQADAERENAEFGVWFKGRGFTNYPAIYPLIVESAMHAAWQEASKRATLAAPATKDNVARIDWENADSPAVKLFVGFDVEAYVEEYELCGEDGDYSPNEHEKVLLVDAIYGVVSNLHERLRKIIPSPHPHVMGGGDELSLTKSGLAIAMTKITAYEAALARLRTERKYIVGCNDGFMEAIEQAARIADEVFASMIDKRDECLSEVPPNCHGALTRARQAQTAEEIGKAIRALSASPAPKDRPSGVVEVCPICDIAGCKHLRAAPEPDWKDDPSSDKRWMAGLDYCMAQLCDYLSVNPSSVMWDAATETLDGDVQSVIGNILRKHFGEDWGPTPAPKSEGE